MNRIMNTLQFKTTCLTFSLLFLTCIFSQTLYETNYQQYIILNRESKDVCLQSLLDEREALLKETTSNLQNCSDIKDAFNEKPCYGNIHNISIFFYFKNIAPPPFLIFIAIERGFNILWPRYIEPPSYFPFPLRVGFKHYCCLILITLNPSVFIPIN